MSEKTQTIKTKRPSRSRAANKEFRRQQLIDATIQCVETSGFSDTTLAKVAEKAGLSQGIVIFHFKSKEALFEETLRYLAHEYKTVTENALSKAPKTAIDQLCALIRSDFDPKICNETKVGIWHSFWGEAKTRPLYKDVYSSVDIEISGAMEAACNSLSESSKATMSGKSAALTLDAMINGLWQKCFLLPQQFDRRESMNTVLNLVSMIYPDCIETVEKYKK